MNEAQYPNTNENSEALFLDIASEELVEKKKDTRRAGNLFELVNNYLIEMSGVPLADRLQFFHLLSAMLSAGLPLLESIKLLRNQMKNIKLQWVMDDLVRSIESGHSLAEAMREAPDIFDEAACAIIEAGEKSGKLTDVMTELVIQNEQLDKIMKKIKGVMIYPIVVITTMVVLAIVVLIFVIPKLEKIFGGAGNLPLPTQIMIFMSNTIQQHWLMILLGLGAFVALFRTWKKSESGSRQWGSFVLSIPIVGMLAKGIILSRVTRIFGFLLSSGVPVVQGLKITSHVAENDIYREKLLLAADDLTKGISLADNLADNEKLFDQMLINMIAIGEKSASLDTIMISAADFYKDELERKVDNLSKIMEPVILGFIALGAVFMILAIYLPILQMNDKLLAT